MKKLLLTFVILTAILTVTNITLATNQYIEYESGEKDDDAIYLETYEDYLNALQGVDEQKLYKEEYERYKLEKIKAYEQDDNPEILKAIVTEVEETVEEYYLSDYTVNKTLYQPIKVKILEGEHEGEVFDTYYMLLVDSNENIKIKPIKANDKINAIIFEEDGETYVYATTVDSAIRRINITLIMLIITVAIIFIYLGNKAFKVLPHLILLSDLLLIIFVPEMIIGRSIIWMSIVTMLAYIIVDSAVKVGVNAKMFASILTTIAILLITTGGLLIYNHIAKMSGIIFEVTMFTEIFPKGTLDIYNLNLALYMLMATIVISDVACKTIKLYSEKEEQEAKEEVKEHLVSKIPTVAGILLITTMPKYLYMLICKYTIAEILNSEMLTNEIVRILFLIIAMAVTTQVGVIVRKIFVEERE